MFIFTDPIQPNTNIVAAHHIWNANIFNKISTPFNLPRISDNSMLPSLMLKIEIKCIREYCRNWWGYEGYFLSLLVEQNTGAIWNARGGMIGNDI